MEKTAQIQADHEHKLAEKRQRMEQEDLER